MPGCGQLCGQTRDRLANCLIQRALWPARHLRPQSHSINEIKDLARKRVARIVALHTDRSAEMGETKNGDKSSSEHSLTARRSKFGANGCAPRRPAPARGRAACTG